MSKHLLSAIFLQKGGGKRVPAKEGFKETGARREKSADWLDPKTSSSSEESFREKREIVKRGQQ